MAVKKVALERIGFFDSIRSSKNKKNITEEKKTTGKSSRKSSGKDR